MHNPISKKYTTYYYDQRNLHVLQVEQKGCS